MSCPDWFALITRRDEEPERWERALEHHKTCDRCREEALDAEPTLLFQRMPVPELDRQDFADIKQAVATMRRTLPLAEAAEKPLPQNLASESRRSPRSLKPWLRAAALGAVLLGVTSFEGSLFDGLRHEDEPTTNLASLSTPDQVAELGLPTGGGDRVIELTSSEFSPQDILPGQDPRLDELPLVEDADPSYGSIVEVVGQDISFVLVLPSLDV